MYHDQIFAPGRRSFVGLYSFVKPAAQFIYLTLRNVVGFKCLNGEGYNVPPMERSGADPGAYREPVLHGAHDVGPFFPESTACEDLNRDRKKKDEK